MLDNPSDFPIFSVSEISQSLKRLVESQFSRVQVRGEISGFKRHSSGHMYYALKDENAVIDAVTWRGQAGSLGIMPQEGLEIIATGRLTTYPGRSKYQMVVERMEVAGEGALLKLLEERKRMLAAEGLFDEERKKSLPFLPHTIGIVTSPTGAVIQDMMHRIEDRYPSHIILWPVAVQGEGAAEQVARAIDGFNNMDTLPDLLIVGRGGGSLEDLWAFNEEVVVRAIAASTIPVISAVGHETDVTLADFVADKRAPTPTAAAEFAVPVRRDLYRGLVHTFGRAVQKMDHLTTYHSRHIESLGRGLPRPEFILDEKTQRLDDWAERLGNSLKAGLDKKADKLGNISALLESYSYARTLDRGFALALDDQGHVISRAANSPEQFTLRFRDDAITVKKQ